MEVTITVDLGDIAYEVYDRGGRFKDEFINQVRYAIVSELKEQCSNEIMKKISEPVKAQAKEVAENIAKELLEKDLTTHQFRVDSYSDKTSTIQELIERQVGYSLNSDLTDYLNRKAKEYVTELRNRYDLAFASLIVQNMREQKLLADDRIAELLAPKKD